MPAPARFVAVAPGPARVLRAAGVLCALLLAGYTAQAAGLGGATVHRIFEPWCYLALLGAAAGLCVARAILVPTERTAWLLFAAGMAAWTAGDAYWTLALASQGEPPFPSLSDPLYLMLYPACYAGFGLLVRSRLLSGAPGESQPSLWLDGLVGALAVAAFAAALLYTPILEGTHGDAAAVATNLAYPLGDLLLLAFAGGAFALSGWRPGAAWWAIGLALVCAAAADGLFLYETAAGTYQEGSLLDAGWPAAMLLIALSAWLAPRPVARARLEGTAALAAPLVLAVLAVGVLVADLVLDVPSVAVALAIGAIVALVVRSGLTFGENARLLGRVRDEATTDAVTGLGNRRRLMADLERCTQSADPGSPWCLAFFDLNGFKRYNDSFGHAAGDALLARLGTSLGATVTGHGHAYRLGGDEFCALFEVGPPGLERLVPGLVAALGERGPSFEITSSYGTVLVPSEAADPTTALRLADQRMYADKHDRSATHVGQTRDALLQALREREPELREHVRGVARLAVAIGRSLGMPAESLDELHRAAELHDIGKVAIPDALLHKPAGLDEQEWRLMRQHTVVGERILGTVPALRPVAALVRCTHEHWDGSGYPDALRGEEIPLGSRIVLVCDAFHAMTTSRPYRAAMPVDAALAELTRCAGTQFDARVVDAFRRECAVVDAFRRECAAADASRAEPLPDSARDRWTRPVTTP